MWVTWLIHMCDVTREHEWHDRLDHTCDVTHGYVWHDVFICVIWLIHMCDMTRSYTCRFPLTGRQMWHVSFMYVHDSFICVTWLSHMCDMIQSYVWHDSFICVTWLIHTCDMTHSYVIQRDMRHTAVPPTIYSYVSYDSFIRVARAFVRPTWLIRMWDVWHDHSYVKIHLTWILLHYLIRGALIHMCICVTYVWHDSFVCLTWLIHRGDMTHSHVRHDSFICETWLIDMCDTMIIRMSHMIHSHVRRVAWSFVGHTYVCVCHTCVTRVMWDMRLMTHIRMSHVRLYVWHESCGTPLMSHMTPVTHTHDTPQTLTWLIYKCNLL